MTSRLSKALVISALSTLGVFAASACDVSSNDGSYYCDNSGCYQCDAYGCSTVDSPTHATCSATVGCSDGLLCTTTGCTSACTTDTNCSKGETCQGGLCSAPGTAPGTVITADGGAVTTTTPVTDGGGTTGTTCGATTCTGTDVCVNSVCTAPQNACTFSSQCATGKVCADGACLDPCDGSGNCSTGFACTKGVCEPTTTAGDGGTTAPTTCTTDQACGTGKYCNNSTCVVDTRPQPNCTTDSDCGGTTSTPKKCLAGYCKYTCTATQGDSYCRTIDSRIGYCAADSVCRSSTEANAQCTGPGTCPLAGQSCIDNQCK